MKKLALALALIASPALAQQQSPSSLALQINAAVSNMALTVEHDAETIKALQQQLAAAQAEVKKLKPEHKESAK